jgi:hypothetical protein
MKGEETKHYFETVVFLLFTLMGQFVQTEVQSHKGRADAVVITEDAVYVFEFKITGGKSVKTAEDALKQIDEKDYMGPYRASGKRLVGIGATYDTAARELGEVSIVEETKPPQGGSGQ